MCTNPENGNIFTDVKDGGFGYATEAMETYLKRGAAGFTKDELLVLGDAVKPIAQRSNALGLYNEYGFAYAVKTPKDAKLFMDFVKKVALVASQVESKTFMVWKLLEEAS
ncbi:MAG: hypothetical protein LBO00_05400 [Zoogloeaceae bacterium]|jgi:hypothetical protein|nr:hypothetical protein [Zoogloeaceae bacterium]